MKKIVSVLSALLLCFSLSTCNWQMPAEPDWLAVLTDAAASGNKIIGLIAVWGWNEGEGHRALDYDELFLLSKLIALEAGSPWLNDVVRMSAGQVALNRVASPEFPDTLAEVVYQEGAYAAADSDAFRAQPPPRLCVQAALRLLLGERVLPPQVVYQSDTARGKVHAVYSDLRLGFTYFCESENPELYETEEREQTPVFRMAMDAIRDSLPALFHLT